MAFDINNKISQIKKDLERLEAELDSFNRANYDGSENSNIRKKQKQIKEKQLELLKYRNIKAMQQKDTMEILKLSGFTVDEETKDISVHQYAEKLRKEAGHSISHEQMAKELKKAGWSREEAESEVLKEAVNRVYGQKDGDIILPQHEANDGGPGSGIKGHTTPENEKPSDYDEKEIEKIKAKWKGKESVGGHGSEYGDILNHLEQKATKAGTLPDMDEYFKLNDKLIDLRQSGKKDTEEYKSVEKQRNDFNKKYNKAHKALKEKARSLSSESEQKRLGELDKMIKKTKDNDATEEGAIKEYGKEKGSFEDGWKHYKDSKGNIWELVNPQGSFWMMECIRGPRKGDTATFRKEMVESSMTEDACNKDGGPGSGIKGHKTSYEKFAEESGFDVMSPEEFKKLTGLTPKEYENKYPSKKKNEDACGEKVFTKGTKDADPKVAEAEAMISLFGGVR